MFKERIEILFQRAGYDIKINEQEATIAIDDPEIHCFFARAKEIAPLIERKILDAGIVSKSVAIETNSKLEEITNLGTLRPEWKESRIVVGALKTSSIKSPKGLQGKKIITRVPNITEKFLKENNIKATIEFSDGANEAKIPEFADALVEYANTGETLERHGIKIIAEIMKDSVMLTSNKTALENPWKKEKLENIGMLLKGAQLGEEMVGVMFHVSNTTLKNIYSILPALKKPTVTPLRGENWFDVLTVVNRKELRELLPKLQEKGCTDIIEFPLNKIVL